LDHTYQSRYGESGLDFAETNQGCWSEVVDDEVEHDPDPVVGGLVDEFQQGPRRGGAPGNDTDSAADRHVAMSTKRE
jgi:hypothetical protein